MDYQQAGVNLEGARTFVERIRRHTQATYRAGVMGGIGQFGGLFALPGGYREPVLVSGADGVGTKLKLAFALDRHDTVGIDCVAMNVNDVLCQGAEPLFFLDYIATGQLAVDAMEQVVAGIAIGCQQAGCALLGGETAEMPGFYPEGEYDLAGFCVGIVEREQILDGRRVAPGHQLIALGSSGLHSNGFSLVRKILETQQIALSDVPPALGATVGEVLLTPTRIYVQPILAALRAGLPLDGLAHITGGGLLENLPRAFGAGLSAHIERGSWTAPAVFGWLQQVGGLTQAVLDETFNQGIGMVALVPLQASAAWLEFLAEQNIPAWVIGEVRSGTERLVFHEHG
ncbi:phosphoribosylformylglycinamidine cyclo-ligase [Anthocerotibacter panamensis]|uniref:phosphoribosylformylglycinamidine cyclo-ligase n=1 Tax=Anthocerotibacter panamensis TaxID=2857077 RepID=UPI001C40728A|nr:phosphoribosylformylglycinamidine cyclo-ligase [Anthocerotibacter panamensis]